MAGSADRHFKACFPQCLPAARASQLLDGCADENWSSARWVIYRANPLAIVDHGRRLGRGRGPLDLHYCFSPFARAMIRHPIGSRRTPRADELIPAPPRWRVASMLDRFKVPLADQVRVSEAALRQTVTAIFEQMHLTPEDAALGADVLVTTDLRGVESHGVSNMLRSYVQSYQKGNSTRGRTGVSCGSHPAPPRSMAMVGSVSSSVPRPCALPSIKPRQLAWALSPCTTGVTWEPQATTPCWRRRQIWWGCA